jgi:hypothetical protein
VYRNERAMLINNKTAAARLNSPANLMNRLSSLSASPRKSAMSLFIPPASPRVDISISKKIEEVKENKIRFNPFDSKVLSSVTPSSIPSSSLATIPSSTPAEPTLDNLIENHEDQVKLGLAHDKALGILNSAMNMLDTKLDDIKADKLPAVITAASKVVESIRKERIESRKNDKDKEVHYHFYTPQQKKLSDYEIIDVQASSPG